MSPSSNDIAPGRSLYPGKLPEGERSRDVDNALLVEQQGTVIHANSLAAVQLGYEHPSELIGRPLSKFRANKGKPNPDISCDSSRRTRGVRKNGSLIDLQESTSTFTLHGHVLTIRASSSLVPNKADDHPQNLAWYPNSYLNRDLLWAVNTEGQMLCVNQTWLNFTGQSMEQALQDGWRANVHQLDAHAHYNRLNFALANRKPFRTEYRMLRREGEYRWFLCIAAPHYVGDSIFAGLRGSCSDISDLKIARENLERTETQMAAILDYSPDIVFLQDLEGRYLRVNRKFKEVFHSSPRDTLQKTDRDISPCGPRNFGTSGNFKASQNSRAHGSQNLVEPPGESRTFMAKNFALTDSQGLAYGVGSILTDITVLQNLEQQLSVSQKMENIGRLTGGMAHDFNNLLTGIMIYCGLLLTALPKDSRLRRHVQEICLGSERGATLISQLLILSSEKQLAPGIVNLNSIVIEMQDMLQKVSGEAIQLYTNYAVDLRTSRLDSTQVHQIVLNLVLNARDAMPNGGSISLSTENIDITEGLNRDCPTMPPGPYIAFTVADSGTGMDEASRSQIFSPSYSTKDAGKGRGWGLATVARIVEQSGGFIAVNSKVGEGTEITLCFPVAEAIAQASISEVVPPQPISPCKCHTVLLVEDDDLVRRSMSETLSMTGYSVLSARNGAEALEIVASSPRHISLVITDLIMPGMSGKDLAQRLSAWHPEIPVLLVSGYADERSSTQLPAKGISFFLKPFSPKSLMEKVGEVLRGANAAELTNSGK